MLATAATINSLDCRREAERSYLDQDEMIRFPFQHHKTLVLTANLLRAPGQDPVGPGLLVPFLKAGKARASYVVGGPFAFTTK